MMIRVLIAEDHLMVRAGIRALLEKAGDIHILGEASNGQETLNAVVEHRPDVIILDLGLPDADGQTLSVWLKGSPELSSTPIIVLTAWPEEVARQTVNAYNLNGYLCKPFQMGDLVKKIDSLLNTKSA
jgi:two-component system cell cycle response regulator DivK